MKAYAVAHLSNVTMGPAIVEYVERIDATLQPFGGRYIIHGGGAEVREGNWSGDLIVIEFPDRDQARSRYESRAYQEIVGLRTGSSEGASSLSTACPRGIGRRGPEARPTAQPFCHVEAAWMWSASDSSGKTRIMDHRPNPPDVNSNR